MNRKKLVVFLIAFILSSFFTGIIVYAQTTQTQEEVQTQIKNFFKLPVIKQIIGIVFGLWDVDKVIEIYEAGHPIGSEVLGVGAIIVYLVIWMILFVAFVDIISSFSPFSEWVSWVIGLGLVIAAAQMGAGYSIASWMAAQTARFGAFAIFIGIACAFLGFIVEAFFGGKFFGFIRKLMRARRLARRQEKAEETMTQATQGAKIWKKSEQELAEAGGWS